MLPLRSADGTEQDGIGILADPNGRLRQRLAFLIDGDAANIGEGKLERDIEFLFNGLEHLDRFSHDFRADAVSGQNRNFK